MVRLLDITEDFWVKLLNNLAIIKINKQKNKNNPVLIPNFIPDSNINNPNANIIAKILIVPNNALLITSSPAKDFKLDKIRPEQYENPQNKINFNHAGIGIKASIRINATIYMKNSIVL